MTENNWICQNCQAENPDNAEFCGECGTPKVKTPLTETQSEECFLCPSCGVKNTPDAIFCGVCGSPMKKQEKTQMVCKKCKIIYPNEKRFCMRCGAPLIEKESLEKRKIDKGDLLKILKKSALLMIAFLFFVFSFLPIYKIDVGEELGLDSETLVLKRSAIDNIVMFFEATKEDSWEDIEDSRLGERIEELTEEIEDIDLTDEKLNTKEKRILSKLIALTARATLRLESVEATAKYPVLAVVSFLYIAFAICFLIFSLIDFIKNLRDKNENSTLALKWLAFSPFAILIVYFMSKSFVAVESKMAYCIIPLIVCVGYIAFLIVYRLIKERKIFAKSLIFKSVALCMICLLLIVSNCGIFNVEITGIFTNTSSERTVNTTLDISYYLSHEFDEDTLTYYESIVDSKSIKSAIENLPSLHSSKEFKNGEADGSINDALIYVAYSIFDEICGMFALLYYCVFVMFVLASIVGADIVLSLICKKDKKILKVVVASITTVLSIVFFALNLLYVVSLNGQIKYFRMHRVLETTITSTSVFLLIFAVLTLVCVCFFNARKRKNQITEYTLYQE